MSARPQIQVLLGTYNGERFLRQQIDSILSQTYEELVVLARDDGSSDSTRKILDSYAKTLPMRFRVLPSTQASGHAMLNFMELLIAADAPYLAFADQDDVWLPGKIERSFEAMQRLESSEGSDVPALVFTDLRVVDRDLKTLNESFWGSQGIHPEHIWSLRRLIMQNVVTGCTMLINRPLQRASLPFPSGIFMHDWWIALVASTEGRCLFVRTPSVLYRQHESNLLGAPTPPPVTGVPQFRQHQQRRKYWEMTARQAAALLKDKGPSLAPAQRKLLERYARCENSSSALVRVWNLLLGGFFVNGLRSNLALIWYLWDMDRAKRDFPINPI